MAATLLPICVPSRIEKARSRILCMSVQNEGGGKQRGRPRGFDPDDALDRAMAAFWDAGFAGTSLDALGAATGLNRPSLYLAFGDKRALYRAAMRRYTEGTL